MLPLPAGLWSPYLAVLVHNILVSNKFNQWFLQKFCWAGQTGLLQQYKVPPGDKGVHDTGGGSHRHREVGENFVFQLKPKIAIQGRCKHLREKLCWWNPPRAEAHWGWCAQYGKQVKVCNLFSSWVAHINTRLRPLWSSLALFVLYWKGLSKGGILFFDTDFSIPKVPTNIIWMLRNCSSHDLFSNLHVWFSAVPTQMGHSFSSPWRPPSGWMESMPFLGESTRWSYLLNCLSETSMFCREC